MELDRQELPTRLAAPRVDKLASTRRFGSALRAVVARAPLRVHTQDGALAWMRLAEMSLRLRPLDARLQAEWSELATTLPGGLAGGLDTAIRRLARDVAAIDQTRRLWNELWLPEVRLRPLKGEMPSIPPSH